MMAPLKSKDEDTDIYRRRADKTWQMISVILAGVVTAIAVTAIPTVMQIQTDLTAIQTELISIRRDLSDYRQDRWTGKDHKAYSDLVKSEIASLTRRVESIESRN